MIPRPALRVETKEKVREVKLLPLRGTHGAKKSHKPQKDIDLFARCACPYKKFHSKKEYTNFNLKQKANGIFLYKKIEKLLTNHAMRGIISG